MDFARAQKLIDATWQTSIVPALTDYIKIPNRSPFFDPEWKQKGHMDKAVDLIASWCRKQGIDGMTQEVVQLPGRTPLIFMETPGPKEGCVLLYGHLDKQPEMEGWLPGLGPWTPVLKDDRLYGRGGADDGYAAFASLTALRALQEQRIAHKRCVVVIEACEESGSPDLPFYIEHLQARIGRPDLVICLDSGCANYDQLWCTTSLRGMVVGNLTVEVLREGVHSGDAGGVVASSFRILRQLLSRLENETTGQVLPKFCHVEIPPQRVEQAHAVAQLLGDHVWNHFPFVPGCKPVHADPTEAMLDRTWRPSLAITGAGGLPALKDAGNVLRPRTSVKVSLRVPPRCDARVAARGVKQLFEQDPPYGAKVTFEVEKDGTGWDAPPLAPWLEAAARDASRQWFGKDAMYMGEGGSIPFMGMLGQKFPEAQFFITGVLGPGSNAHGPNEFLDLPTGRKLTGCVAQMIAVHARREGRRS